MTNKKIVLEPVAEQFVKDAAQGPQLYELPVEEGRKAVDDTQSGPVDKPAVTIEEITIPGGPTEQVALKIVRPEKQTGVLPVILYIHGAGWVFGNSHTHDRLIRELAVGAQAAVVFPEYSRSPEAKYPTALEEIYTTLEWIAASADDQLFDLTNLTVAGDSVGGNMTAAITLLAKDRQGPTITKQLLFYPVTDANFDTPSYHEFAEGYFLTREGMQWFWDQYTADEAQRKQITASPLQATLDDLKDLPKALIITAEADVLRDEGEAYANKLRQAGVDVTQARFQGIVHDFVMLNLMANTSAKRGAMQLTLSWLKD
jgi:acetyl esterase/lipase